MKKLLATTALALTLAVSSHAMAEQTGKGEHHFMSEKLASLAQDKQDLIKNSFKEGREKSKAKMGEIKTLRNDIKAIMAAPNFDKSAFLAKSKKIEELHSQLATERAERIANIAAKLTPDERKILMEAGHRGMHRGKGAGGMQGEDKPNQ